MATIRNKNKLAAVSRETPEGTRSSRAQNVLDPESTQAYISQVFEEIEERVTKKLSKELSRTESRILGALSKLDEFLLNPQVRTCSVAVPGTSRSNNSENRETTGERSSDDPCPEERYFSRHSGHLNSPEAKNDLHTIIFSNLSYVHGMCYANPRRKQGSIKNLTLSLQKIFMEKNRGITTRIYAPSIKGYPAMWSTKSRKCQQLHILWKSTNFFGLIKISFFKKTTRHFLGSKTT